MIKNWILTGDTHGRVADRLATIQHNSPEYVPAETAVIILGDAGFNYYKGKKDIKTKQAASEFGYTIYCIRGNHEERISNCENAHRMYDIETDTFVYVEDDFPLIMYFDDDVGEATFGRYKALTIPGAYSVDKHYRLQNGWTWFAEEQLTPEEMAFGEHFAKGGGDFDFVLSHTCPFSWMPTDLFLSMIDQSTVDKTMELWMDHLKDMFNWTIWCFGHYHADRIERPYVEQFYQEYESLDDIYDRWQRYKKTGELEWWIPKSPNFYMDV